MARLSAALLALIWLGAGDVARAIPPVRGPDALESVRSAVRLKNFPAAAAELQQLAAGGSADAQYLLGCFYLTGLSGPRDVEQAKKWLLQAASQRHARAAFSLA